MYEQKMCYIDLYRNGVKCGNMGHVRMEWEEDRYRFGVSLCHMDRQTLVTAVLERAGGRPRTTIQNIAIIHGKGGAQFDWMPLEGNEESLLFQASGEVYGVCRLPKMHAEEVGKEAAAPGQPEFLGRTTAEMPVLELTREAEPKKALSETPESETLRAMLPETPESETMEEAPPKRPESETLRAMPPETPESETPGEEPPEKPDSETLRAMPPETQESETPGQTEMKPAVYPQKAEERRKREQRITVLSDDKWKQLCSIYPNVHPIGDHVDFLKITPADFVILRQEYQNLVRNSFLLHGYYNYGHILLGKYPDQYYIGVPGIMHEQERIAAAMFGFVGFERAKAPKEQTENREQFGYYMMEVGI